MASLELESSPAFESTRLQVIFVHGLGGDAEKTWGCSGEQSFWPAWLVDDTSGIAIWTFSYPSFITNWSGSSLDLQDVALQFLELALVEKSLKHGPILFVGHSLGGLIIKQVLRLLSDRAEYCELSGSLLKRSSGVAFFATPHTGSEYATLLTRLGLIARSSKLTEALKAADPNLRELNNWYRNWSGHLTQRVYVESKPTYGLIIVDRLSAEGGFYRVPVIPVEADHISICKPKHRNCLVYKTFLGFVQELVEQASGYPTTGTIGSFRTGVFSGQRFSKGLAESLVRYNAELRDLTVDQVRALNASKSEPKIWVSGEAGTGKSIFAVEAAFRALKSGQTVLLVFRSTQFRHVFGSLLGEHSDTLHLLPHLDFLFILRETEKVDSGCLPESLFGDLLPELERPYRKPPFDLLIVDDCGAYESDMPRLTSLFDSIGHRVIVLAAPDQMFSALSLDRGDEPTETPEKFGKVFGVRTQILIPPEEYEYIELTTNIRNASNILTHASAKKPRHGAIKEPGLFRSITSNWSNFEKKLLDQLASIMESYPPENIRVIVDPFLSHPLLEEFGSEKDEITWQDKLSALTPITRAVLLTSCDGNFLHSTLESENELAEALELVETNKIRFIYTDGSNVGVISDIALNGDIAESFEREFSSWPSPHVDAGKLLNPYAFKDPFESCHAILMYQTPLFIGLESDVIIYIRNKTDLVVAKDDLSQAERSNVERERESHHFMAMSRAKYHLIEIFVE